MSSTPVLTLEADSVASRRLCNFLARHGGAVDPEDALAMARGAVALSRDSESFNALAGVLNEIPGAELLQIDAAQNSLADNPDNWAAWHNLSLACLRSYQWDRAEAAIMSAFHKLPEKEANPYIAMQAAFVYGMIGDQRKALVFLEEAEKVADRCPDATLAKRVRSECNIARFVALAHMKKWDEAFAALSRRHELSTAANVLTMGNANGWLWSPESGTRGTLATPKKAAIVYLEWGLGDQIQFARYVSDLIESGTFESVAVACSAPLMPVMATLGGIAAVIDRDALFMSVFEEAELVPVLDLMADHWKKYRDPIASSEVYLGVPAAAEPEETPNFALMGDVETAAYHERAAVAKAPKLTRQPGKLAIGFSWQGDPRQTHDWNRRIPLAAFGDWARKNADRFTFHSLQSKFAGYGEPWAGWPEDVEIQDCSGAQNFGDVAALMQECDFFVGQCGGLIHLAGALGKDAAVMLGASHDWRWDSWPPLYHSVMGVMQSAPGDWESAFDKLTDAILQNVDGSPDPLPGIERPLYPPSGPTGRFIETPPDPEAPESRPTAELHEGETQS